MRCDSCGRDITTEMVAYEQKVYTDQHYQYKLRKVCSKCADSQARYPAVPCRVCGRPVRQLVSNPYVRNGGGTLLCSERCRWTEKNDRRKLQYDPIPCAYCDTLFTPLRSGGKFCSSKCRVYAFRKK
jgi:hypothetical protein